MPRTPSFIALTVLLATGFVRAQPAPPQPQSPPGTPAAPGNPDQDPGEGATVTEARLTALRGDVEVTQDGTRTAHVGDVLGRGVRVRTGASGTATLTLPNGATITLAEHTQLVLFGSPAAPPGGTPPSTMTTLVRGTLHLGPATENTPQTETVPVTMQAATVFVGRAEAMVAADVGGHIARMGVYRGRLRVRTPTREYLLPAGLGVLEEFGRPPPPFRLMPRAPVWRTPPPEQVLSLGEFVDVSGAYGASPGGVTPASWRVEVSRDEGFHDLVSDTRTSQNYTRWQGHALAPGTWYVRVYALDVDRFESGPSAVAAVRVAAPGLVAGEPPTGNAPGRCAAVMIPRGFYCGLDGAPLALSDDPFTLSPGRVHRLRCAITAAGRGARESTITVEQSGPLVHELRVTPPVADAAGGTATGEVVVTLRDALGRPVSWDSLVATGSNGVTIGDFHETDVRGAYNATMRWPSGVRTTRLQVVVNNAVTFDQDATVGVEAVAVPAPPVSRRAPETVEVIRGPVPRLRNPDDDDDEGP